jgi:hypothetical protein
MVSVYVSHDITDVSLLLAMRKHLSDMSVNFATNETDLENREDDGAFVSMVKTGCILLTC